MCGKKSLNLQKIHLTLMKQFYLLLLAAVFCAATPATTLASEPQYVVPECEITPDTNTPLETLSGKVYLKFPQYASLLPPNYVPVSKDGEDYDRFQVEAVQGTSNVAAIIMRHELKDAGVYTFSFEDADFYAEVSCGVEGDYFAAFDVVYVISGAGINDVSTDDDTLNIYLPTGVPVALGVPRSVLTTLPPALYIINGRPTYLVK